MLPSVEKLLILQERDRQIAHLQVELSAIAPQRANIQGRVNAAEAELEAGRAKLKHLEADRKKLELEVESRKQLIEKYSLQQFQTKRNEEYRALTHEIENCRAEIVKLEDQQLEIMEQAEATQKLTAEARHRAEEVRREAEKQLADLATREQNLRKHLAELTHGRTALAAAVDSALLHRYERLRKSKGDRVVVGVEHGACGGCHVGLPAQVVIGCRAEQEITACPNCGRILYYTRDMDMVRAE